MIDYDSNNIRHIFTIQGSTVPRAIRISIPSVVLAAILHYFIHEYREHAGFMEQLGQNASLVWSIYVLTLGTLLTLRSSTSYQRFWEGITLVQQMRAEWFETASNLIAFSMVAEKNDPRLHARVNHFQHVLVRLLSLLHGAALCQIGADNEEIDMLDVHSLDQDSMAYLQTCEFRDVNRVEVILHWIQVMVTDSQSDGVLQVAAPILTRAYQTLSRGMVNLHNARKLADVPFPLPLAQFSGVFLLLGTILHPILVSVVFQNMGIALIVCFIPIFGGWHMNFVAGELEQPFGSDPNDLPLTVLQYEFNISLLMLLDKHVARAPYIASERSQTVEYLKAKLLECQTQKIERHTTWSRDSSRHPGTESQSAAVGSVAEGKRSLRITQSHGTGSCRLTQSHTRLLVLRMQNQTARSRAGSSVTSDTVSRANTMNTICHFSEHHDSPSDNNLKHNMFVADDHNQATPSSATEKKFNELLDISTQTMRALNALLPYFSSNGSMHSHSCPPPVTAGPSGRFSCSTVLFL